MSGQTPAARSFHTLTAVGNRAVLFGGRGTDNSHFADFDVFDFGRFFASGSNVSILTYIRVKFERKKCAS